ncbi:hypothetical protein BZA05DRAFT_382431, partial [Tricharina praecox]|uniref:uncharacterized protein n=1 Tax=Tricharina praecox TaxID=43433 RepID=UPI002220D02C
MLESMISVEPASHLFPPFAATHSIPFANIPELPVHSSDHIELPGSIFIPKHTLSSHLTAELDVSRLNRVHDYLWLAGRAGHIRQLHRQRMMEREIVVAEQTDLHLVHQHGKIYIKPLPLFLMDYNFFAAHLCTPAAAELHASACGLLASYVEMILHESDFRIAVERGLLPADMLWPQWAAFAGSIRAHLDLVARDQLNKRYVYGELRCDRLNWIYRLTSGEMMRGYHYIYTEYGHFFGRKLGWLILVFAYITVILTALQVALGTAQGTQEGSALEGVGYQLSMITIYGVVGIVGAVFIVFLGLLIVHLKLTLVHWRRKEEERRAAVGRRKQGEMEAVETCKTL